MTVNQQSFSTILSNAVAAVQGAAAQLLDFSVGSVLRAILEATSAIALWLQGIALQVASLTRFSTSSGSDADSWAADFAFYRLPGQTASGSVVFSRFTPTSQAVIPVGTIVQTADGTEQYAVVADTKQSAYSASLNAYVIPASTSSCTATVSALIAGSAGNVAAGLISVVANGVPGVDTVANPSAFTNGADTESDTAFRARFVLYIAGLGKGTVAAVESAIAGVQQGVIYSVTENLTYAGAPDVGYFYVIADDGSGNPSNQFISNVYNAVDAVRPIGSTFNVFAPILVLANVSMSLTLAPGYNRAAVDALVSSALTTYMAALGIGATLPYTRLAQIAYDASPGITNVTGVTLNGSTADIVCTSQQVCRAGALSIT